MSSARCSAWWRGDLRRHGVRETGRRGPAGGDRAALCAAQATSAVELRGAGLSSGGFGLVSRLCPAAVGVVAEEVGAAQDDQRDPAPRPGRRSIGRCWPSAQQDKLESGAMVRIDSTVTAALMHEPSDSTLLWDCGAGDDAAVAAGGALPGAPPIAWRDHRRAGQEACPRDPVQPRQRQPSASSIAS